MDPVSATSAVSTGRLPRTRGDGPHWTFRVEGAPAAPPHTRGWTLFPSPLRATIRGSPAHAGMDPPPRASSLEPRRLPRTRGDGPGRVAGLGLHRQAPPHTRGWTVQDRGVEHRRRGSPAHAGMDPCLTSQSSRVTGLPRTRGDGPRSSAIRSSSTTAPPHTRGWTFLQWGLDLDEVGSPAHAGMDPPIVKRPSAADGLPRTRGDGPVPYGSRHRLRWAPPHTRGWTGSTHRDTARARGSPAHAGMDPERLVGRCRSPWLPRTRGDGPVIDVMPKYSTMAPPHTRGWTLPARQRDEHADGSPAHAGMDPGRSHSARTVTRLPRTRGDGPRPRFVTTTARKAPPHTRGWTCDRRGATAARGGSPAHAGMDLDQGIDSLG